MASTSSSRHRINGDRGLNSIQKMLWIVSNALNNAFPRTTGDLDVRHFAPIVEAPDWDRIHPTSSPSRALSDLFWMKIDWPAVQNELGEIRILDIGCGSGGLGLRLQSFSGARIVSYCGVDKTARPNWSDTVRDNDFMTLVTSESRNVLSVAPPDTNLIMTQSAIEHFDDDLVFFEQVKRFIERSGNNVVQIHLFPSAACRRLYRYHGVRQYTPRTVRRILRTFEVVNHYAVLFALGGVHCNRLHYRSITLPHMLRKTDLRRTRTALYRRLVRQAIEDDRIRVSAPSFYAMVIHANHRNSIFADMSALTGP